MVPSSSCGFRSGIPVNTVFSCVPVYNFSHGHRTNHLATPQQNTTCMRLNSDAIRLYLPQGTCGNTMTRLYTNLQHYYDSQVTLISASGESIF
jgi:hypothetical protein